MPESQGVTLEVLAERIRGIREDVAELRQTRKEDHHRLRGVEAAVKTMIDAQQVARQSEAKQYRKLAASLQAGMLAMSVCIVVLTLVTLLAHH